ncbi:telomere-binding alpha subunit central domain protein [Aspergillus undulatus]|uniref:telomere-binding alpha subunit central domain protein n=1 Tax=Aspergillus undulatus TaxID=1810928 RepID=UPI003CCE08D3
MATRPPPGYVDVTNAVATRGVVNVMGVVVDIWGGAFRSQGTSVCITFTIKDSDLNNGHTWDGLKIKYFQAKESMLPPVHDGDVILLRNITVKIIYGKTTAVASQDRIIPYAIFRADRDPTSHLSAITGPVPFEPTYQEKSHASALLQASPASFRTATVPRAGISQDTNPISASNTQKKFSLLKDVRERQFADLIGEIVKIHGNDSEKLTVYLTDYTEHEDLFCYASDNEKPDEGREGDQYNYIKRPKKNWNGPSGRRTIQITLWEPHASSLRGTFSENELVRLKNVHIKASRVEGGALEGAIHQNRDKPHVPNVFQVDPKEDPRVQQLLARKEEYWKAHPKKRKRKADEDAEPRSKKSNAKKKRSKAEPKKEVGQTRLVPKKRIDAHPNIHPRVGPNMEYISLEEIIDNPSHNNRSPDGIEYRLPFQNLCYLSTVRVVDFYPPLLEDFAVLQKHTSLASSHTYEKWEWRFCLLVESPSRAVPGQQKERVRLFVSHSEAEHLLKMSPTDLRKKPDNLEDLRNTIWHLWGNLEELKRETIEEGGKPIDLKRLTSVPFRCGIMEYGIQCNHSRGSNRAGGGKSLGGCSEQGCFGWERRFGLLKTTIHETVYA